MKRLAIMSLTVLLCGAVVLRYSRSIPARSETESPETIHYADISGDYLFISNFDETERMAFSPGLSGRQRSSNSDYRS